MYSKNLKHGLGMVVIHAFNPPTQESGTGEFKVPSHMRLHSGTLPQKTKQKEAWSEKSLKVF